jgi:hypothetical protein
MDAEQKSSTQQTLAFVQVVVAGIWRRRNWLLAGAALGAALGAFRAARRRTSTSRAASSTCARASAT